MRLTDHIDLTGTSVSQKVADGLVRMILDGTLKPGERVREAVIATDLGLSRNTVREAVRLLENTGLVRYIFNKGLVIWNPVDADVVDVYKARLQLELAAVASVDDATDFSSVHEAFDRFLEALRTHDVRTIVEADLAIHQAIVGLMGSERLNGYYAQLMNELRYFLLVLSIDHREYEDTTGLEQEHRAIIDALTLKDPAQTREILSGIIEENRDAVREILEKRTKA